MSRPQMDPHIVLGVGGGWPLWIIGRGTWCYDNQSQGHLPLSHVCPDAFLTTSGERRTTRVHTTFERHSGHCTTKS